VLGREIASHEGFSYSSALAEKEGTWDYEALDAYLADPRGWAPGNKMAFAGVKKPEDRADVILYLRSLSDSPEPLPEGG
jgi:cytochrome c